MNTQALLLSRAQFALTTVFHMIWPLLTIGLSLYMVVLEILWLRTRDEAWYRHVRFWSRIFVLVFGIGVASGIPLEFEFGTNWSRFSTASGALFGNILAFEGAMAFALEAAFLAIFLFGWNRVSRGMHLFSNIMVCFGATLSAFWILAANSWMQTPAGVVMADGRIAVLDYVRALFNPDLPVAFPHMWVACVETTLFFVGGISAWFIVRGRNAAFFLKGFKVILVMGIVAAPLQVVLGDTSGLGVVRFQPAKSAAMEANWQPNAPGTGAPWVVVAWPDQQAQENRLAVTIPFGLSLLETRTLTGRTPGLSEFPRADQPPVVLPFFAFRIMVLLAFVMVGIAIASIVAWARGRLDAETAPSRKRLWGWWVASIPFGLVATECGWIVREMGRQPWIIYGLLRTADGVSPITAGTAAASLAVFAVIYVALLSLFIIFTARILQRGPDLASPLPHREPLPAGGGGGAP
jgi:cytochrome d ubiquinol oxidase subunit I